MTQFVWRSRELLSQMEIANTEAISSIDSMSFRLFIERLPDAALVVGNDQIIRMVNTATCTLFDTPANELVGSDLGVLIPDRYRERHEGYVREFFESPSSRPMGAGLRFSGKRRDGSEVPVDIMINGIVLDGEPVAMAVIRDNTDRVMLNQLRHQLQKTNTRLERAQKLGRMAWWELDVKTGELTWSDTLYDLLGLPTDCPPSFDLIKKHCHPEDRHLVIASLEQLKRDVTHVAEFRIQTQSGNLIWVQELAERNVGDDPGDGVIIGAMRDITRKKELEEKLKRESITDELTGLYNRKFFDMQLKTEFANFRRSAKPCAMVMLDFDHFKAINDRFGHAGGDQVLERAGRLIVDLLRQSDYACRIGGEEFALILPGASEDSAVQTAKRCQQALEESSFDVGDQPFNTTITAGVSSFHEGDDSIDKIMRRADKALYRGKSGGRNQVVR